MHGAYSVKFCCYSNNYRALSTKVPSGGPSTVAITLPTLVDVLEVRANSAFKKPLDVLNSALGRRSRECRNKVDSGRRRPWQCSTSY